MKKTTLALALALGLTTLTGCDKIKDIKNSFNKEQATIEAQDKLPEIETPTADSKAEMVKPDMKPDVKPDMKPDEKPEAVKIGQEEKPVSDEAVKAQVTVGEIVPAEPPHAQVQTREAVEPKAENAVAPVANPDVKSDLDSLEALSRQQEKSFTDLAPRLQSLNIDSSDEDLNAALGEVDKVAQETVKQLKDLPLKTQDVQTLRDSYVKVLELSQKTMAETIKFQRDAKASQNPKDNEELKARAGELQKQTETLQAAQVESQNLLDKIKQANGL